MFETVTFRRKHFDAYEEIRRHRTDANSGKYKTITYDAIDWR
jgi:hypothetical protein